ncbi:MAG: N-acetylmuramoyl-L-alanine amidase [Nocardioidaceae bacterium]|nr:N-acetylmuramoyl-L-alanine amidase [Nocardioidaceae bacterium]
MPPSTVSLPRRRVLTGAVAAAAGLAGGSLVSPPAALGKARALAQAPFTSPAAGPAEGGVAPAVKQIALAGVDPDAAQRLAARDLEGVGVLSPVVPSPGYAAVGVTWAPGSTVDGRQFFVRTQTASAWSDWQPMHVDPEHGPSSGSLDAQTAMPGTDPVIVGDVDAVQVKVTGTDQRVPAALTLSVIDPGEASATQRLAEVSEPDYDSAEDRHSTSPRPRIRSRKQWGANESMRDGFAGYGKIRVGYVHHTVNTNGYSRRDVPAIIRGIYAYHTQSQGWSDIGYNFLVDRFGRIWEGRWGGIGRPVIGAHTYGYNEKSFAMAAIGNFQTVRPRHAMLRSYARVFSWKLGRNHINARGRTTIDGRRMRTLSGHRDAGSTSCPGGYLYARLGRIRRRARKLQLRS